MYRQFTPRRVYICQEKQNVGIGRVCVFGKKKRKTIWSWLEYFCRSSVLLLGTLFSLESNRRNCRFIWKENSWWKKCWKFGWMKLKNIPAITRQPADGVTRRVVSIRVENLGSSRRTPSRPPGWIYCQQKKEVQYGLFSCCRCCCWYTNKNSFQYDKWKKKKEIKNKRFKTVVVRICVSMYYLLGAI